MQDGLALFPLALLHIVAHSLYKAHAFLAAVTAVHLVAAIHRPGIGPAAIDTCFRQLPLSLRGWAQYARDELARAELAEWMRKIQSCR